MAGAQQQIANLRDEVAQPRGIIETLTPKFGNDDDMLAKNDQWNAQVDGLLTTHDNEQKGMIIKQDQTIAVLVICTL